MESDKMQTVVFNRAAPSDIGKICRIRNNRRTAEGYASMSRYEKSLVQ